MDLWVSFFSGIVAAFTPCIIVLMPILLYRFFHDDTKNWTSFSVFVGGFLLTYIVFGYFLSELFTSFIQNGLKFGFGLLFVVFGLLAVFGKLNPFNFPMIKNPFLFGFMFALIVSLNPCTIPYFGMIVSISNNFLLFLNLIFFGLGLIVPAILFAFFGKKILYVGKQSGKVFHKISYLMNFVLILSGFYLIYTIKDIKVYDIYVISLFLGVIFLILLKSFFIVGKYNKNNFSLRNVLLFLALVIMLFAALFHCKSSIEIENKYSLFFGSDQGDVDVGENNSCSGDVSDCEVCQRCMYIFLSAALVGFVGIALVYFKEGKLKI